MAPGPMKVAIKSAARLLTAPLAMGLRAFGMNPVTLKVSHIVDQVDCAGCKAEARKGHGALNRQLRAKRFREKTRAAKTNMFLTH